jgi:hypothetical protein
MADVKREKPKDVVLSRKMFDVIVTEFTQDIGYSLSTLIELTVDGHLPEENIVVLEKMRTLLGQIKKSPT